jgi:hypothetical protein
METLELIKREVLPDSHVSEEEIQSLETILRLIAFRNEVLSCVSNWLLAWTLAREICDEFPASPREVQEYLSGRLKNALTNTITQGERILKLALEDPCSVKDDHFKLATGCVPGDIRACISLLKSRLIQFFEPYNEAELAELRESAVQDGRKPCGTV